MKVSLIAPPFVEVPPRAYGGTERRLDLLGRYLERSGVEVMLFASGDSTSRLPRKAICDVALFNDTTYQHERDRMSRVREINERTVALLDEDTTVVNTHDYDNPDLIERLSNTGLPILVTIRHALTPLIRETYEGFRTHPRVHFHGLTHTQVMSLDPEMPFIHNADEPDDYEAVQNSADKLDYFISIGDMKPIKAHKTAIDLAKRIGLDIIIAGVPMYPESKVYFESEVRPKIEIDVSQRQDSFLQELVSGSFSFGNGMIIYFGHANDQHKKVLYKHARFSQHLGNIEVEGNIEACPGTLIESLLSGTPVLGVVGSVTEELLDSSTGINVSTLDEAVRRCEELSDLAPKEIREAGKEKFSAVLMAQRYIGLYHKILS